jgi:hypothetical protein
VAYLNIRAGKINVLGISKMEPLIRAITGIKGGDSVRCLVVVGGGDRAWIGGANIKEMVKLDPDTARGFISRVGDLCESVRTLPVQVIAVINGWCLGMGSSLLPRVIFGSPRPPPDLRCQKPNSVSRLWSMQPCFPVKSVLVGLDRGYLPEGPLMH